MKMHEFDEVATNVFGKIYPLIARQAIECTKIKEGVCVDLGSGCGHLGLAVSEITDMKVYLLDISQDAKAIANKKIQDANLKEKVFAIKGDIHSIPLKDNSIDLAISRASYHSWSNKVKAIKEVHRVLKVGGKTYIGGGYGSLELKEEVEDKMIERKAKGWIKGKKKKGHDELRSEIMEVLIKTSIDNFEIITDDTGYWIIISKE